MRTAAAALVLAFVAAVALLGPWIATHPPSRQFRHALLAPPTALHVIDAQGRLRWPFVYARTLVDPVGRRYEEDRTRRIDLRWFRSDALVSAAEDDVFLLGTDSLGRDVFSRLVVGARASLGAAAAGALCAVLIGIVMGGVAGFAGGWIDELAMRFADFVLVLPALYVMLALRAAMPLVLPPLLIFLLISGLLAVSGWPLVARAVRAVIAAECRREYIEAARAAGAGPVRLFVHHLLPATAGVTAMHGILMLPMFIAAEATLSFAGVGFTEPAASWGTMLQEAANVRLLAQAPWLLAPAAAIMLLVFALTILGQRQPPDGIVSEEVSLGFPRRFRIPI